MNCKNCGKKINENWSVCPFCSTPIEKEIKCFQCGMKLESGWQICPNCATLTPAGVVFSQVEENQTDAMGTDTPEKQSVRVAIEIPEGTIFGRYFIIRKIGQGCFGAVFEARDRYIGWTCALKVLPMLVNNIFSSIFTLHNACKNIRDLKNIILVDLPEPVMWQGQQFVVYPMLLVYDGSLRELLPAIKQIEDVKEKEKLIHEFFIQMCNGVNSVHEAGIIHLDIKPENFLFPDRKFRVTDFGISRILQRQDVDVSAIQEGVGTCPYMAPEQHDTTNPLDVDKRADIYAMGIILYEMFSGGKRPYEGEDLGCKKRQDYPPKKLKEIEQGYWQIIEKCLHPDLEKRYQSMEELMGALAEISQKRKIQILLNEGNRNLKSNNYKEAIRNYRELLELDKNQKTAKTNLKKAEEKAQQKKTFFQTNLVFVKGGTFQMGINVGNSDNKPIHSVTISDFYLGKYELTQKEWKEVMENNPSHFKGNDLPVMQVNWFNAICYCNRRSKQEGLNPCYNIDGDTNLGDYNKLDNVICNFHANGYRLPTEAEWEYAARGGNESRGYKYSGSDDIDDVAWYCDKERLHNKSSPVGTKQPNELGFYDMSGNVFEWCNDWYCQNYYSNTPIRDPKGPNSGSHRILRGGTYHRPYFCCRLAYREHCDPLVYYFPFGFRIARTP